MGQKTRRGSQAASANPETHCSSWCQNWTVKCTISHKQISSHTRLHPGQASWHKPDVFSVLNETCPPGYHYLQKACSTGHGGGLSVYRDELDLSPLPLPELSSFECLAFKCRPPFLMTVLVYRPPKPNPAFILEMHNLLSSFCAPSANTVILGDMNIHLKTPSCCRAAEFLQFLDYFNLTQHVDVPTPGAHSRSCHYRLCPYQQSTGVWPGHVWPQGHLHGVTISVPPHWGKKTPTLL